MIPTPGRRTLAGLAAAVAAAALAAGTAQAQSGTTDAPATQVVPAVGDAENADDGRWRSFLATDLIGTDVRNPAGDTVGEIEDLLISRGDDVQRAVLSVGGFLGIDDRLVAVDYDELRVSRRDGEDRIVYDTTEDALKAMPVFEYDAEGPNAALRASDLLGDTVYNGDDDGIGEIEDLVIGAGDSVPQAVVSVGGFLGIDDKHVTVPYAELGIERMKDGDRIFYDATRQSLEASPAFSYDPDRG